MFVCVCLCVFVCVWQSVCLYKSGLVVLFDVFKAFLVPSSLFAERRKERDAPDMGETPPQSTKPEHWPLNDITQQPPRIQFPLGLPSR